MVNRSSGGGRGRTFIVSSGRDRCAEDELGEAGERWKGIKKKTTKERRNRGMLERCGGGGLTTF
jgi:hypothetical protein